MLYILLKCPVGLKPDRAEQVGLMARERHDRRQVLQAEIEECLRGQSLYLDGNDVVSYEHLTELLAKTNSFLILRELEDEDAQALEPEIYACREQLRQHQREVELLGESLIKEAERRYEGHDDKGVLEILLKWPVGLKPDRAEQVGLMARERQDRRTALRTEIEE